MSAPETTVLSFCGAECMRAFDLVAAPAGPDRCARCGASLRREPPPWTSESRALLVELARLVRVRGPALERALRALDRDAVHALRLAVRDFEWERTALKSKAARLGLRGLH